MNATAIRKFCMALPGDLNKVGDKELKELIARSHTLVAAKLTKKVRESLQ